MNYTGTAFVALVIHLIINYDILKKNNVRGKGSIPAYRSYRRFLISVMVFYVCDTLWGLLYDFGLITLTYINTMIFFAIMAFSVFLWTRFVVKYLKVKNVVTMMLFYTGWFFLFFQWIVVIINFFLPILFSFDENGVYTAEGARFISMMIQLLMFLLTSIYMIFIFFNSKGKVRLRHLTIGLFGIVMTIFVFFQIFFPFLALYSVGYMIGTCLLHTFVLEDMKEDQMQEMKDLIEREYSQRQELGSARQLAYTDSLTGVRNKHAYAETEDDINAKINSEELGELAVIVFDLNGLKKINDTKGHDEGNHYIKEGCRIICRWFKRSPVFRIGGDEFVALLDGDDFKKRKNLLNAFNKLMEGNIKKGFVVISTGMAEFDVNEDKNLEDVFRKADKKMYERKKALKCMGSL